MEDKSIAPYNPWSELTTVTTFDRGNNTRTTQRLDSTDDNSRHMLVSFSSQSLLIEALVNLVCEKLEKNVDRKYQLYIGICDAFAKLNLIDGFYKVKEFHYLRSVYHRGFQQLLSSLAVANVDSILPIERPLISSSRYQTEFIELEHIATGGFGKVFKAVNRLDGAEYAVKKIRLSAQSFKSIVVHLEEVKAFAKLNHPNVVSYKCAWMEPIFDSGDIEGPSIRVVEDVTSERDTSNSSDSGRNEDNNTDTHTEDSHSISFRNSKKSSQSSHSETKSRNYSSNDVENNNVICTRACLTTHAALYIQMALCDGTLRDWLRETQVRSQRMIMDITVQIFQGEDYIHSQKIVHHDIKPSNIFISRCEPLRVQIGDFGLACRSRNNHRSALGGTPLYVAPEQEDGVCTPKSDVYSAGIVLFELLVPTSTQMEHSIMIENLRRGQLPTTLAVDYPKLTQLVSQLVQDDPEARPTAGQIVEAISTDKDMLIAQLRNKLQEMDDAIQEKNSIIREKDLIIQKLLRERTLLVEAKFATDKT